MSYFLSAFVFSRICSCSFCYDIKRATPLDLAIRKHVYWRILPSPIERKSASTRALNQRAYARADSDSLAALKGRARAQSDEPVAAATHSRAERSSARARGVIDAQARN